MYPNQSQSSRPSRLSALKTHAMRVGLCVLPVASVLDLMMYLRRSGIASEWLLEIVLVLVVVETIGLFLWALVKADSPWQGFRLWLSFQLVLLALLWCVIFWGGGAPPPPLAPKCGTGTMMLLLLIPPFAVFYALASWIVFGMSKKMIEVFKPNFYTISAGEYGWDDSYQEGGLSLAGEQESGALSFALPSGQLSLESQE